MFPLVYLCPALVTGDIVTGQGDHFHPPFLELGLQLHAFAQLRGTDRGVVRWVREQDAPTGT